MAHDFFENRPLLVHLDGKHVVKGTLESVFLDGFVETLVDLFNPRIENVGKPQKERRRHIPQIEFLDKLVKIDFRPFVAKRTDGCVSFLVDIKVANSPSADIVKIPGIVDTPIFHFVSVPLLVVKIGENNRKKQLQF